MAETKKMKQVISASRRTDIPAFYLNWFIRQIQQGWVDVANPFFPQKMRRVHLTPQHVAWIVFWSRNYGPFLRKRFYFADYQLFFHFTILSPSMLEKHPVPLHKQLSQMEQLVQFYGAERIIWRYDPLVFWWENNRLKTNYKVREFKYLAETIGQMGVSRCYTSLAYPYAKFRSRFKQKFPLFRLGEQPGEEAFRVVEEMVAVLKETGLRLYACCTDVLLQVKGVEKGRCIDGQLLNQLNPEVRVSQAKAPTRAQCGCTRSVDIGDYRKQPCYIGCLYCYANPVWK